MTGRGGSRLHFTEYEEENAVAIGTLSKRTEICQWQLQNGTELVVIVYLVPSMALQFVKAADRIAWGRSTPSSADYSRQ